MIGAPDSQINYGLLSVAILTLDVCFLEPWRRISRYTSQLPRYELYALLVLLLGYGTSLGQLALYILGSRR